MDAPDTHLGAVLQQLLDGSWALLSFYSSYLSDAEKKYSLFDHEHLAAYSSLKPLTHALFRVSPPWSARQQLHLFYLAEFTSSVVHVPGPENVVADTLSRPSTDSSPAPVPALVSSPSTSALVSPLPSFYLVLTSPSYLRCSSSAPPSRK